MGSRSGVSTRGYHPAIYAMHESMRLREQLQEEQQEAEKARRVASGQLDLSDIESELVRRCKDLEGFGRFIVWYDSKEVPEWDIKKRIEMLTQRIARLEFQTITTRIQQVEESLQAAENQLTGTAYTEAHKELMSELIELGDKLQVYETVG